jgi:lipopolysaccharide transport system ATP-binding protein
MEGDRTSALDYRAPPRQDLPTITRAIVTTSHPGRTHKHGQPLSMDVVISTPHSIKGARLGFHLVDRFGHPCAHFWLFDSEQPYGRTPGVHTVRCTLPHLRLGPGLYTLKIWLGEYFGGRHFETVENVCPFEVAMFDHPREGVWQPDTFAYIEDVTSMVLPTDSKPEPSAE